MDRLWTLAQRLEGKTLYTEGENAPFKVVEVTNRQLTIEQGKDGVRRTYSRGKIEAGCCLWLKGGELTLQNLRRVGATNRTVGVETYLTPLIRAVLGIQPETS